MQPVSSTPFMSPVFVKAFQDSLTKKLKNIDSTFDESEKIYFDYKIPQVTDGINGEILEILEQSGTEINRRNYQKVSEPKVFFDLRDDQLTISVQIKATL